MRRFGSRRQLPPQTMAVGVGLAFAVIAGVGGSLFVALPDAGYSASYGPATSRPESVVTSTGYPEPTSAQSTGLPSLTATTTTSPALDFVSVSGGGGIVTEVPAGWPHHRTRSPTVDEAVDPADSLRLLRYGGAAPADGQALVDRLATYEQEKVPSLDGYRRVRLEYVASQGLDDAAEWEFEYYDDARNQLHCSGHYWLAGGIEYVLFAQSRQSDWEATEPMLERMIDSARVER